MSLPAPESKERVYELSVQLVSHFSIKPQHTSPSFIMAASAVASIHDISLPKFCKTGGAVSVKDVSSPDAIVSKWLSAFESTLASGKASDLTGLIHEDGWWRDQLAVDWEFHTKRGIKNISSQTERQRDTRKLVQPRTCWKGKPFMSYGLGKITDKPRPRTVTLALAYVANSHD